MDLTHHASLLRVERPQDHVFSTSGETTVSQVVYTVEILGIDDVRSLIGQAYQRPFDAERQRLLLRVQSITHEAQNALLKVLEEPPLTTEFLFVVPIDIILLPTLSSRLYDISTESDGEAERDPAFSLFHAQTYRDRLAEIDERLKRRDTEWQRNLKQGLVSWLTSPEGKQLLQPLEFVARTLLTRGASNKMLLEHTALLLPTSSDRQ